MPASLIGVGVGPGDPELVTLRALRVLREADCVYAPVVNLAVEGRAESIVRQAAPEVSVRRVCFVMERDSQARSAAITAAAERLITDLDKNHQVAFITLGDPSIYSTFGDIVNQVRKARPQVPIEWVPGIMAFQELAGRTATVVVDGAESLRLVTGLEGMTKIEAALSDPTSAVVVYKAGHVLGPLAEHLGASERLDGAVVGELLGLDDESIGSLSAAAQAGSSYLATVLIPPSPRATPNTPSPDTRLS